MVQIMDPAVNKSGEQPFKNYIYNQNNGTGNFGNLVVQQKMMSVAIKYFIS